MSRAEQTDHEIHCQSILHDWLNTNGFHEFSWLPERNDPPDVWLQYQCKKYAVEIARIAGTTPEGMPGETAAESLLKLGHEISVDVLLELERKGRPLQHYYSLNLAPFGGVKIKARKIRQYFTTAISKHYIDWLDDKDKKIKRILDIHPAGSQLDGIKFLLNGPNELDSTCKEPTVIPAASPHGLLPDMGDGQAPRLITAKVKEKYKRLKDENRPKPWILVLDDLYCFEYESWEKYLPEESAEFQAIFRIHGKNISVAHGALTP